MLLENEFSPIFVKIIRIVKVIRVLYKICK